MSAPAPKRNPIPFGKYLLLDRINIGGMAEVWRGKAFGAGGFERLVAIKRILPNIAEDEEFTAMFIDEAKISVQLAHANIAQTYDLGQISGTYYIAMEYVAGKDLRAVFDRARKRKETLPLPLVCHVMSKVCEGLDHAHRKKDGSGRDLNIVHRDVSPQNLLLSYDGEVKVIDFGIAKAAGRANKTQAGILKGKFGYMSPEQILGRPLDCRTDVFALGVCLHELLCGQRLFTGESDYSVLEKVRNVDIRRPSELNREIPPELEAIVLRGARARARRSLRPCERHGGGSAALPDHLGALLRAQGPDGVHAHHLRRGSGEGGGAPARVRVGASAGGAAREGRGAAPGSGTAAAFTWRPRSAHLAARTHRIHAFPCRTGIRLPFTRGGAEAPAERRKRRRSPAPHSPTHGSPPHRRSTLRLRSRRQAPSRSRRPRARRDRSRGSAAAGAGVRPVVPVQAPLPRPRAPRGSAEAFPFRVHPSRPSPTP